MKKYFIQCLLFAFGVIILITSCEKIKSMFSISQSQSHKTKSDFDSSQCIQGKYIGSYCFGSVIQILDTNTIGKNWKNHFNGLQYVNCVLASIDSIYYKSIIDPSRYFSKDSIFYFKYIDGGYSSKLFVICEPSPFITITFLSPSPCNQNP